MAKKRRNLKFNPRVPSTISSYVDHGRCINCGKSLSENMDERQFVLAKTRHFPVCGNSCAHAVEVYIKRDERYKTFLYAGFFLAALAILIVSFFNDHSVAIRVFLAVAGAFLLIFPYPISSFETFQSVPIRSVTIITRIIGLVIMGVALALHLYM